MSASVDTMYRDGADGPTYAIHVQSLQIQLAIHATSTVKRRAYARFWLASRSHDFSREEKAWLHEALVSPHLKEKLVE